MKGSRRTSWEAGREVVSGPGEAMRPMARPPGVKGVDQAEVGEEVLEGVEGSGARKCLRGQFSE